jgi:predicted dehydrogenase
MEPIRWAILGTGAVAEEFAKGLKALPDAELYAIGSRGLDRATAFAKTHKIAKAYGAYEDCIADPLVDIVYIATPNHRHAEDIRLCLRGGKAVLCEKPFALNAAQARDIVALARSLSLFCMEGMWMRFIPLVREFRDRVKQGVVGRPVLLTANFGVPTQYDASNRFFSPELGGGALLDRGIYLVSLAFWLFGKPDAVAAARTEALTGVDETAAVVFTYQDGPLAVLNTSLAARYDNAAAVYGDLGAITVQDPFYAAEEMTLVLHGGPRPPVRAVSLKSRAVDLIKRLPGVAVIARRLRAAVGAKRVVQSNAPSAYRYEAAEAMRCLRLGLVESPDMPLDETILILDCLDEIQRLSRPPVLEA